MKKLSILKNPRFRYGSLSTLILCLLLAALIGVNFIFGTLEKKNGWRVDYSFNGITTTGGITQQILDQLPHPVHIYALFPKGQEDGPLMELLDRYAAASDLVSWEQTDIALNPGLLTRYQSDTSETAVSNDSLIVTCEATGRWKVLAPGDFVSLSLDYEAGTFTSAGYTYESRITSAINYVTRSEIPCIQVLQGHNELNEAELAVFTELMTANHFDVQFFSFADQDAVLDPDDTLAILSPMRDFTDEEMEKLTAFAGQGGSFLFTCDYTDPLDQMPNYQALLRSYGFLARDGLVIASAEEAGSYYSDMRIALIPTMLSTDVTYDLVATGVDTLLLVGSRAFEIPGQNDRNLDVSTVLSTGYKAYLRSMSGDLSSLDQKDEDELGPFALSLQARRVTTEGYISRAFVLGCSTVLTDAQIHAMTDSQEFILRVVEFLLDADPVDLNIMAKSALRPQLSVRSVTLGSVLLVALPLSVLAVAFIVLWPRRNR
ncbi:MAG: hypothetical protein E7316_06050 [Clostridiales bacterium]|nr:hypothetical protein [Clostridiales bacterium]